MIQVFQLPAGQHHTVLVSPADVGDEMFAADVGGDHRSAHDVPRDFFVAEEVALYRAMSASSDPQAQPQQGEHVGKKDRKIEGIELGAIRHNQPVSRHCGRWHVSVNYPATARQEYWQIKLGDGSPAAAN